MILVMIFTNSVSRVFELAAVVTMKTRRAVQYWLRPFGITVNQYGALMALTYGDGMTQRELADRLETDTTTAMVICDGLEKKELIQRVRESGDRRANHLRITEKGRITIHDAAAAVEQSALPLAEVLTDEEITSVTPLLGRLAVVAGELLHEASQGKRNGDNK